MDHHGCSFLSRVKLLEIRLVARLFMTHAHIDIVHHLSKDDTLTAIVLNDDVEHYLVAKVVALTVQEHITSTIMLINHRRFGFDSELEEFVGPNVFTHYHAWHIQFLVTSDHDKLDTFGDLDRSSVLKGPHVFYAISLFEHKVLLEHHVVELGLELRLRFDLGVLSYQAFRDDFLCASRLSTL